METKLIKVKDSSTQYVCVALKLGSNTQEGRELLTKAGVDLNINNIYLILIEANPKFRELPIQWDDRALKNLHTTLKQHWSSFSDEVIYDVTDYFESENGVVVIKNLS